MDKSEGIDPRMLDCIQKEIKLQDNRLNKAYKNLIDSLNPERKKQLQEAQRLWIRFRDINCSFYYDPKEGGTLDRLSANDCFMTMTANRAKELEILKK